MIFSKRHSPPLRFVLFAGVFNDRTLLKHALAGMLEEEWGKNVYSKSK
jgi:hypothetical protein